MDVLKDFRIAVVRYTLLVTVVAAAVAWAWSPVVAKSLLLGGLAGAVGFWITGWNIQKLASPEAARIQSSAIKWTFVRLLFYAFSIYKAHTLDREHHHGLIAVVVGIFIVQVVMITMAFTSLDNSRKEV